MDFVEHLKKSLPLEEVEKLVSSLEEKDCHAVLLNTNKISDDTFKKEFPNVKVHPYVSHAYLYDKNEYQLGKHIYHELGYYYLQEPSAMIVSSLINFKETDFVLDLCAAPGGKSVQASLKMNGKGLIISNDISSSRAGLISNNIERLGLKNIIITNNDFSKIYTKFLNTFDKIILDAPCSGSGMFRKGDIYKEDWSINKVYKYAEIQKELILMCYKMLKPGGLLSYSTCSYSKEEDEDVVSYLLDNSDASISQISLKDGYINKLSPLGIRLMPSHFFGEGQYICHINKPGDSKITTFINENKYSKYVVNSFAHFDVRKYGDYLFATTNGFEVKNLHVIRYGVKVGEMNKDYFKYDLHYARSLTIKDELPYVELSEDEVKKYLEGNQLNKVNKNKGYVLVCYQNNIVDITKTDGNVVKNHYPKGLRKKF